MKGKYYLVKPGYFRGAHDASFKMCICTMLLVLCIFGIISSIPLWFNSILSQKYTHGNSADVAASEKQQGETTLPNIPAVRSDNEKMNIITQYKIDETGISDVLTTEPVHIKTKNATTDYTLITLDQESVSVSTIPTPSSSNTGAKNKPDDSKECQTSQCYNVASRMLSLLNATANPCDNFYNYACGGLFNNPLLLEEDASQDVFARIKRAVNNDSSSSSSPYKKFKNFIDGCVDYDNQVLNDKQINQGEEVLDGIGRLLETDNNIVSYNLTELIKTLLQHGSAPLFDVQLDVDSDNSSKFQLVITPPDFLKFSFSSHFVSPEERRQHCLPKDSFKTDIEFDTATEFETYQTCMRNTSTFIEKSIEALSSFKAFKNMTDDDASLLKDETRKTLWDIFDILQEDLLIPQVIQEHIQSKYYINVSIGQLQTEISMIEWTSLFHGLFNVTLEDNFSVQVYSMDQIKKVFVDLNSRTSKRKIYNALLAIFAHDLFTDIVTTRHRNSREHYCLKVASSLMPMVASNLYISTFSDIEDSLRNQMSTVFNELKDMMKGKLKMAKWLNETSLDKVIEKLDRMTIELPSTFNKDFLSSSLDECSLDKQYIQDSICLLRQFQTQLYQRHKFDPQSPEVMWTHFLTAFSTKTIFVYNLNKFMIPLTVLAPLYDEKMPKSIVMATLGNLLARGIGHNFDRIGIQFSATGSKGSILSEESEAVVHSNMVTKSNSRYYKKIYHMEDGHNYTCEWDTDNYIIISQSERMSDLIAANLALSLVLDQDTLLPWVPRDFTPHRVYFLALTQKFCTKKKVLETFPDLYEGTSLPAFERVNTLFYNLKPFSETFNCSPGSNMSIFPMLEKSVEEKSTPANF